MDDEGSIIYDGEKFVVNHPGKVPDNFDPGDKLVVGLPKTHPSHPQNRKPSPAPKYVPPSVIYTAFDNKRAEEHNKEHVRVRQSVSGNPAHNQRNDYVVAGSGEPKDKVDKPSQVSSAQAVLPDIVEAQDDYDTDGLTDDLRSDRIYAYSNLDILRVKQDMERRPLTFKLCFEQSQSPRSALEFLYAEPPDCNDRELIALQTQGGFPLGMAGGDDTEDNGATDIDLGIHHLVFEYEEYLESKYGYRITWGKELSDVNMLDQVHNLAKATSHIVNYLREEVYDGDEAGALAAFQQHFSQSEAYGQLVVYLGDDYFVKNLPNISEAGYYGFVPLPQSSRENLDKIFLGSKVNIATIVHEFGHVIDRSRHIVKRYDKDLSFQDEWVVKTKLPLNELILQNVIEGFAGKQLPTEEIWADLFMTAVLDPSNPGISEPYQVYWTTYEPIYELTKRLGVGAFYNCTEYGGCSWQPVKWQQSDFEFAEKTQEYFPKALSKLLSG